MWIIDRAMDRVSCLTHLIGAIFSFLMLFVMIIMAKICKSDLVSLIGAIVFGVSSIALYSASSMYHYYSGDNNNKIKRFLRKLDHSMIYVLIALALVYTQAPKTFHIK